MRKKILAVTAAFILAPAVLFAGAAPVAAHGGHTSCAGGVVGVINAEIPGFEDFVSGPGKGPAGAVIKFLATGGDAGATVLLAHVEYCE